jgi:hypothetical protein
VALILLAALCISAYHALGEAFYGGYHLPQGLGIDRLLPEELAQAALFSLFGTTVLALVTAALTPTGLPERIAAGARWLGRGW